MGRSERLLQEIRRELPGFRIAPKSGSRLQRFLGALLRVLTLGGQSAYLTRYYTVVGRTLWVPDGWEALGDDERYVVLCHERVHLRQFERCGLFGMSLLYLLPFFPVGLAYFRARLEWEAYRETLRATIETRGLAAAVAMREDVIRRFTGPAYGWMWPFPRSVGRWFDEALVEIGGSASG